MRIKRKARVIGRGLGVSSPSGNGFLCTARAFCLNLVKAPTSKKVRDALRPRTEPIPAQEGGNRRNHHPTRQTYILVKIIS
jgi:hypothetical protein